MSANYENYTVAQLENILKDRETEQNLKSQKQLLLDKIKAIDGKDGWEEKKTESKPQAQQTHGMKVKPHRSLKELNKLCQEKYKK